MMNAIDRCAAVVFDAALVACPVNFRREYGAAMRRDFARCLAEERAVHGVAGAVVYASGATADVVATASREYAAMFVRDITYAFRSLGKTPAFALIVVATLALAIGANAAVFSILSTVALAPLPYADPSGLIALDAKLNGKPFAFSLPSYIAVTRGDTADIESAAAYVSQSATLEGAGKPASVRITQSTASFFETLGIRPQIGRFPVAADGKRGAARVAVIADALWRERFGGDPDAIGRIVRLDGLAYRIIGVAPASFLQPRNGRGFDATGVWTLVPEDGAGTQYGPGYDVFFAVARLRPGRSLANVRAALPGIIARLALRNPDDDRELGVIATPLGDSLVGSARGLLLAIFGAVSAVLLVACANVANLLLSRAASREREFSVRIAIGASRARIVAQLLVETFVLALAGGALGIGIAYATVGAFVSYAPASIPRADAVTIDAASILYTLGIVAFCTLVAGLAPALAASHRNVAEALKNAGRGGDAHTGARSRNVLVTSEIAMTLALVVAAGLVVRSFATLVAQPLGFSAANVTAVGAVNLPPARYATDASLVAFMERARARARTIPGVVDAAWAYSVPFVPGRFGSTFTIEGRHVLPGAEPNADINSIDPGYFHVLGARMRAGRGFNAGDGTHAQDVAIVNEAFARTYFPGRSALGARITPSISNDEKTAVRTVVGVAVDVRATFGADQEPTIYVPVRQLPVSGSRLLLRERPGTHPAPAVAAMLAALDPELPKADVTDLSVLLARSVAVQRLTVGALVALAFVALVLSLAGIFAVVSYAVTQRTHEFGVRMALGAQGRQIVRMVLGHALRLAVTGVAIGLVLAAAGTRLLAGELFETQPLDPATFVIVTALVIVAATAAALIPARRATRVDPIVALRYE